QVVNLPPNHIDIKMSYYKIGDVYCKMEKLEEALERYEIACLDNSQSYMTMHTNLVELYCKRNDYLNATREEEKVLSILREQLPKDIVKIAEDRNNSNLSLSLFETLFTNRINIISGQMFAIFLQDLIFIYLTIGDIYVKKESINDNNNERELNECITMYDKAINLHLKLIMYQDENLTFLIYEKLGNFHEINNNLENAIKNYDNVLEEIKKFDNILEDVKTKKYALYYKLGNFSSIDKKYADLIKYRGQALTELFWLGSDK
ncbi:unnamed protein product, partial [Didymodactylos carnosus]